MSRLLVVIADEDEKYLSTLEYKFLQELDDKIDLEIISDKTYFESFFSSPKTAEIVAVCESFYSRELQRHNINNLFVMTENKGDGDTAELAVNQIYKYTGIKEIYNEMIYRSRDKIEDDGAAEKETKIIAMHSAIGGSGKTVLGMALADSLEQNHRKVLYINAESIQEFGYYLKDKSGMTNEAIRSLKNDLNHIYTNVRPFIRKEGFSYLPPFQVTLDALNLEESVYENLVRTAKESKEYDFIIVDIEAGYSREKMGLLQQADRALVILLQDELSVNKTEYLLRNIDVRDREKYLFVCNKYDETGFNACMGADAQTRFTVNEYVELMKEPIKETRQFSKLQGIQKLAYMFI